MFLETKGTSDWWDGACVYQIYPRSFYDSDSDGVGDLRGIIKKLDYLAGKPESLGINAIWISPFYPSPLADFGYDVSDYRGIDPLFGSMVDFDRLVQEAHLRGVRVIIDFVPNHSSNQHTWFKESLSGRESPKRNWYVWKDPKPDGSPPNNWMSVFGGSAWEFEESSQQYYLHTFLKQQPDLNWDNQDLRKEMKEIMKFWLEKGVDGLRIDAVSWLSKDLQFRDDPVNPRYRENIDDSYHKLLHTCSSQGSKLFDYLNEMIDVCRGYENKFMITEAYPDVQGEISHYLKYYQRLNHNICIPFNFECISFPWDAGTYKNFVDLFQEALLPGQPAIYNMGNHDKSRLASRLGRDSAKTAAMLLLSLPGIPFIYYGDEIGMQDVYIPKNKAKDPFTTPEGVGRDPSRTPMQWNEYMNAGFSTTEPWLPLSTDYKQCNVESESRYNESFLNLYKDLIAFRKQSTVLRVGAYQSLELGKNIYGFVRENLTDKVTVVLNFSNETEIIDSKALKGRVVLSTYRDIGSNFNLNGHLKLRPHEGVFIAPS
ncbi:alpha-amylase [Candidatus Saccharibacteria bacterium]|nr:alpha-amylase [Candidatus Saccharibacteria bacterium]